MAKNPRILPRVLLLYCYNNLKAATTPVLRTLSLPSFFQFKGNVNVFFFTVVIEMANSARL